jgi:signal transduction histidine kinase
MAYSISRRIHWYVFAITLVSLLITITVVSVAHEAMENSILRIDLEASRDFVLDNAEQDRTLHWEAGTLIAFYEPKGLVGSKPLPALFKDLPFPYSAEIEVGEKTYLVTLSEANGGRLYLAKDITLFENRVTYFEYVMAASGVGVLLLATLFARIGSARLVKPLLQLTDHIRKTRPGHSMARAPTDLGDRELRTIAGTFNLFLDELEDYVKREQSLLSLSSHELRTPIAVISGALDVIVQRDQLATDDRKTLDRAQRAAEEMKANIDMILKLGRRKDLAEQSESISLVSMMREVIEDLSKSVGHTERVLVEHIDYSPIRSDPVLVKMLLRNLVQNAIQHTPGNIYVRLDDGEVEIADEGPGLPEVYQDLLQNHDPGPAQRATMSGLGLVIVTLICDRLGWQISATQGANGGTVLLLRLSPKPGTAALS